MKRNLSYIELTLFYETNGELTLENNGQTIILHWKFPTNERPTVTGGPLGVARYQLEFMYFNWLNESVVGELKHEGIYFGTPKFVPMELHMVLTHSNMAGDFKKAFETNFGLAVLSFKYAVCQIFANEKMLLFVLIFANFPSKAQQRKLS